MSSPFITFLNVHLRGYHDPSAPWPRRLSGALCQEASEKGLAHLTTAQETNAQGLASTSSTGSTGTGGKIWDDMGPWLEIGWLERQCPMENSMNAGC